ncbi:GNAT family N-acetyltransferase [Kineococcus sp. SYSU DK003]|uniref:GNAT family N-acetyltransferase n=1 Tax=Kineococcus sp. SYSU DK003 TaxID=3383124 RepID=UPI003D7C7E71
MTGFPLSTSRLLLRRWTASDREPLAALNADPEVMRYFPSVLDREASDRLADYADGCFETLSAGGQPFGLTAVERRADGRFLGFTGLHRMRWYPDDVEIGWRLARDVWGQGLATEAARAWVARARDVHALPRLISVVHPGNAASLAVTRKLGMREGWRAEAEGQPHVVMVLDL